MIVEQRPKIGLPLNSNSKKYIYDCVNYKTRVKNNVFLQLSSY